MRRRPMILAALTVGAWAWLQLGTACNDDTAATTGATGGGGGGLGDVIYASGATDEALEALLAATVRDDPAQAAYLTTPTEGASIDPATALAFAWRVGPPPTGDARDALPRPSRSPAGVPPFARPAHGSALAHESAPTHDAPTLHSLELGAPRPTRTPLDDLGMLLGPARVAYAHGAPVNGRAYLLVIRDDGGVPIHRVFTLDLTYTPAPADGSTLTATPGTLRASVLNAVFEDNRVAQDGGPWQGPDVTFTFAP